jgi:hypothetical protein
MRRSSIPPSAELLGKLLPDVELLVACCRAYND